MTEDLAGYVVILGMSQQGVDALSTCVSTQSAMTASAWGECAMVKPDSPSALDLVRTSASSGIVQPRCVACLQAW